MGKPEEHNNDTEIHPLSMSSGTFEDIRSVWSFPSELLRTMLCITPVATEFETENHIGRRRFAYARRNIGHDLQRFANPCLVPGLMLRSARSRDYSFSLALIYNRGTGSVSGLLMASKSMRCGFCYPHFTSPSTFLKTLFSCHSS